jgi:hypothetical protein
LIPEAALRRGGVATLVSADLEHVTLDVPFASPPGSTVELLVANAPLGVKVRSCRKLPDSETVRYRIEGRWTTLPRAQRDALGLRT